MALRAAKPSGENSWYVIVTHYARLRKTTRATASFACTRNTSTALFTTGCDRLGTRIHTSLDVLVTHRTAHRQIAHALWTAGCCLNARILSARFLRTARIPIYCVHTAHNTFTTRCRTCARYLAYTAYLLDQVPSLWRPGFQCGFLRYAQQSVTHLDADTHCNAHTHLHTYTDRLMGGKLDRHTQKEKA